MSCQENIKHLRRKITENTEFEKTCLQFPVTSLDDFTNKTLHKPPAVCTIIKNLLCGLSPEKEEGKKTTLFGDENGGFSLFIVSKF